MKKASEKIGGNEDDTPQNSVAIGIQSLQDETPTISKQDAVIIL